MDILSKELIRELKKDIKPFYDKNDVSHKWNHAISVMTLALKMNKKLSLNLKSLDIIAASLLHDFMVYKNRDLHHIEAFNILFDGRLSSWYYLLVTKYGLDYDNILLAILEHRASYDGEFTSPLSELISSADRLYPNIKYIIRRYFNALNTITFEPKYRSLVSKYGLKGYARYPEIYNLYFENKLENMQRLINNEGFVFNTYISLLKNRS